MNPGESRRIKDKRAPSPRDETRDHRTSWAGEGSRARAIMNSSRSTLQVFELWGPRLKGQYGGGWDPLTPSLRLMKLVTSTNPALNVE